MEIEISQASTESHHQPEPCVCVPCEVQLRECTTPTIEDSCDELSEKDANRPMLFRCLLLLLPVAIPIIVYLKDINAMRRVFLTAFILVLVIVLSCIMVALLRRRRRHIESQTSASEMSSELTQRHFMSMPHRFGSRSAMTHGRCRGDCEYAEEIRRPHGQSYRASYGRMASHYHLASTTSRSPSPQSTMFTSGPLPLLSFHFPRFEHSLRIENRPRNDDPPSYEDAMLSPPEIPHQSHRLQVSPPETPPPPYEAAVA